MICNCLICCLPNFVNGMANEIPLSGGKYYTQISLHIQSKNSEHIKIKKKIRLCIYKIIRFESHY